MAWQDTALHSVFGPLLKASLWMLSRARLPQASGTLRLPGLTAPVEVLRDRWGAPPWRAGGG